MGEYLGRLHLNVNGKPQYRERNVLEAFHERGESTTTIDLTPAPQRRAG